MSHTIEPAVLTHKKKKERITIMKTMILNLMKRIVANYMSAMNNYGEALLRGKGLNCA